MKILSLILKSHTSDLILVLVIPYRLKRLRVPVGGDPISTMTYWVTGRDTLACL